MKLPDYQGRSIVNLMSSVLAAYGKDNRGYAPLADLAPEGLAASNNIVLLIADGLGYRYLQRYGGGSTLSQHLQTAITSVFPTTTATAVSTFLTGVAPQQHAITGWHTYLRELGTIAAVLPFRPRWGGASFNDSGITPSSIFDQQPLFDRIDADSYIVTQQRIIDSGYSRATCGKATRIAYTDLAGFFAAIKQTLSTGNKRKYIYAYWPELDGLAHVHGIHSQTALNHFLSFDAAYTAFIAAIAGSNTTVIVTGDHGLVDTAPEKTILLNQHPVLADTLALPLCGEPRMAYCYVRPCKVTQFTDYVRTHLAHCCDLYESATLVKENYFGLYDPHPRLHERIGDYVLLAKDNFVIKDFILGEAGFSQIGVHGGLSEDELLVPLIVAHP